MYPAERDGDCMRLMVYGLCPAKGGADYTGIPLWGDPFCLRVFEALHERGLLSIPMGTAERWRGAALRVSKRRPLLKHCGISYAWPICPTRERMTQDPVDRALAMGRDNQDRISAEIVGALQRKDDFRGDLGVLCLGAETFSIVAPACIHKGVHPVVVPLPAPGEIRRIRDQQAMLCQGEVPQGDVWDRRLTLALSLVGL